MFDITVGVPLITLLVVIAFLSGIGITTMGPGGIFVTIALYSLTSISSAKVAGTAHATFVATGLVASAAYVHSGEMKASEAQSLALVLSLSSVVGAPVGAYVNAFVPRTTFGLLLGGASVLTGIVIVYRERRGLSPLYRLDVADRRDRVVLGILGFALGVVCGLLGVGGPVLAVPALILVGIPMLSAVAVAQVQSIFIAAVAASGYYLQGNLSLPLAIVIGLPLLAGAVVGWRVAHLVEPARLKVALGIVLVAIGPYLAL